MSDTPLAAADAALLVEDANAPTPGPGHNSLALLVDRCQAATALQGRIERGEELLKQLKAELRALVEKEVPDLMAGLKLKDFTLEDETVVKVKQVVAGSIPKATQDDAFEWLTKNRHGGLIRTKIVVEFGPGGAKQAANLAKRIAAQKGVQTAGGDVSVTRGVHAGSLGKWAREMLLKGEKIPLDILGIYTGQVAEFTLPKPPGEEAPTKKSGSRKT